ncbi:MAG TPA: helix-turn-helix domain-containing protein [Magnetospirillaceae bacterium]|nr:helix-turn-helix domain-containing protein [Magnetospirillaceae bacterium]
MYVRAISSAADGELFGESVCLGLGRQAGHLMPANPIQHLPAGELLFSEGDKAESVFEVLSGMVRLYKLLPDGRRQVTGFLTAGQLLGLAPEGTCVFTADTITEVSLCRYKRDAFERMIDEVPGFARRLLAVTSHELHAAQDQMVLLGRKSASEKVATFLLMLPARQDDIDVPMTRGDIADYLGLTVETVSRTLTRLRQDGLIALPVPARIRVLDRKGLENLASGDLGDLF